MSSIISIDIVGLVCIEIIVSNIKVLKFSQQNGYSTP